MCGSARGVIVSGSGDCTTLSPAHVVKGLAGSRDCQPARQKRRLCIYLGHRMNGATLQPALVLGEKVWCSACQNYVKVVRVTSAAKIVDVDRRTVYNYVKKKKVFAVKVAGSTLRVCSNCLLRPNDTSHVEECTT